MSKSEKAKKSDKSKSGSKPKQKSSGSKKSSGPWYSDGLQFECTQCGACCSGEPGYVWVNQAEIDDMSDVLGMAPEDFEHRFVRQVGTDRSLVEYPDGDCILLDPETRKCTVYHARPIQCRTWPFWDSNLERKKDWKETCEVCPGAGKGKLYTFEQIELARKEKSVQ